MKTKSIITTTIFAFVFLTCILSGVYFFNLTHYRNPELLLMDEFYIPPPIDSFNRVKVVFAGDAMLHETQLKSAMSNGEFNFSDCFNEISPILKASNLNIVNFETCLCGQNYSGYPVFCSPDEFAKELNNAGFNFFYTANNHINDKGLKGLTRTLTILDSLKINHTGSFINAENRENIYPKIIVINDIKIALLNYTYGTNLRSNVQPAIINIIDTTLIYNDILKAKEQQVDFIIAGMHWGDEYSRENNKYQKKISEFLLRNGVDIIAGSHPHVVQKIDIEKDSLNNNKLIIWSLGNFISNMTLRYTDGGILVEVELLKNKITQSKSISNIGYYPIWVKRTLEPLKFKLLTSNYLTQDSLKQTLSASELQKFTEFISDLKHLFIENEIVKEIKIEK